MICPGEGADMSAAAYFFAMKLQPALNVPIGIIDCYWGGTSITCWMDEICLSWTDEGRRYLLEYERQSEGKTMETYLAEEKAWQREMDDWNEAAEALKLKQPQISPQELGKKLGPYPWHPPVGAGSPYRPHGLFHTMLERVVPYTLTGILYYQGEEDTWRTEHYDILLAAYILRLRELFLDNELPFLNVQLPMWIDANAEADSKTWPRLRLAQQKVYRNLRNTGLTVLIDQGEYDNIHPTNKRVVGERLFESAMEVIYHRAAKMAVFACAKYALGGSLHVLLSAPVYARESGDYLMEVAGQDGIFHPAEVSLNGAELILTSQQVSAPIMARYAWTDYGIVCLFGPDDLPLAPFWLM